MQSAKTKKMVIESLNRADQHTIERRAERIMQISSVIEPASYIGEDELLSMIEEARACFINGLNISTLVIATSCIERMLITELKKRGYKSGTLNEAIEKCAGITNDPEQLLDKVSTLLRARNAYVHIKTSNHESRRVVRADARGVPPTTISEEDALLSIVTMYKLFNALTLDAPYDLLANLGFPDQNNNVYKETEL